MGSYIRLLISFGNNIPIEYNFEPSAKAKEFLIGTDHGKEFTKIPGCYSIYHTHFGGFFFAFILEILNVLLVWWLSGVFLLMLSAAVFFVIIDVFLIVFRARRIRKSKICENKLVSAVEQKERDSLTTKISRYRTSMGITTIALIIVAIVKSLLAYFIVYEFNLEFLVLALTYLLVAIYHIRWNGYAYNALRFLIQIHKEFKNREKFPAQGYSKIFISPIKLVECDFGAYKLRLLSTSDGSFNYQLVGRGILFDDHALGALQCQNNLPEDSSKQVARDILVRELTHLQMEQLEGGKTVAITSTETKALVVKATER